MDRLRESLSDALIATDFDGTLSPIVIDPASARPVQGAIDVLVELRSRVAELAVISGRPLSFLRSNLPVDITMVGLYGMEVMRSGALTEDPSSGRWRELISRMVPEARAKAPDGVEVEAKDMSMTLHYRRRPEAAALVERIATELGAGSGLSVRAAKMSIELHPDVETDKGTVLRWLASEHLGPVMFLGDDVGDLPAYDVLRELRDQSRIVVSVAVAGSDTARAVMDAADLVADGPAGAVELLRSLLD